MHIKELGHVVLYVVDVTTSANFYKDTLGFTEINRTSHIAAFSSGRTHHELLLIEVGGEKQTSRSVRPGLYHIGFKVGDTAEELKEVYKELKNKGVEIIGASDHTVTHSLYILDPDKNELELYVDITDAWKDNPQLILTRVRPLNLDT